MLNFLKVFKIVSMVTLFWGNAAFADRPTFDAESNAVSEDHQTISSWTAHLNHYYPALRLTVAADLSQEQLVSATLQDLQKLEDELQGGAQLPDADLTTLACSKPVCGDH